MNSLTYFLYASLVATLPLATLLRSQNPSRSGRLLIEAGADKLSVIYFLLKFAHVVGAAVILGTGSGIAFFMLMAHRSGNAEFIARMAGLVVLADMIFTATAVVLQPITGYLLMRQTGVTFTESWVAISLLLYLVAGAFWLPVVWIQARLRDLARAAGNAGAPLPPAYHRLFLIWFLFGFPGFGAVLAILFLMIAKPVLY
jgi:uncharacterized membrane protein